MGIPRKSLAWAALVVACWGITLGPIVHAVLHDRPHRHEADGSIVFLDALDESLPHVHADGTVHGSLPRDADQDPAERQVAPPGHHGAPRHGASSLAHFGVALTTVPSVLLPLGARDDRAPAAPVAESAIVVADLLASQSPRGPPV